MEVSIYELLAAARESAKSDYIKGDSILCEKRFHPDTHYISFCFVIVTCVYISVTFIELCPNIV